MSLGEQPSIPGYQIKKTLGQGGMASVYLALQESVKRKVALKIMSSHLGEESVWAKRFIQEAQVIAQLSHPNVVPVYDVGVHDGQFYIAMEYLESGSLKDRMQNHLPLKQTIKIVTGIAAGLDFAGEKGFVHRDIKPDNIMFRQGGSPVILDFGIVKQMGNPKNKMTQTGMIVGTTAYMSPEQAQGKELDCRSDIYSLGILFYELLTGDVPFTGESDVAVLLKHVKETPPPLPDSLQTLQPVIDMCLAKEPGHRYSRAREIIEHLKKLEPELKTLVHSQEQPEILGDNQATLVKSHITSSDQPTIISSISSMEPQTKVEDDDDITRVLSSAKATIKDFSAESQQRKAKHNKQLFLTLAGIAVIALGYVGYQNLYIVPKERALAEAKIQATEQKLQQKIDSLFRQVSTDELNLELTDTQSVNNFIATLREILKLEPENKRAQTMLTELGNKYIQRAQESIKNSNIPQAEIYRDYAQQLTPTAPQLSGISDSIRQLRTKQTQKNLNEQLLETQINTLLSLAQQDIKNTSGFSESAYSKLKQILTLDENNDDAKQIVAQMITSLIEDTNKKIKQQDYNQARSNIAYLNKYAEPTEEIKQIKQNLEREENKYQSEQAISRLISQANQLDQPDRNEIQNNKLIATYKQILSLSPNNQTAENKLAKTQEYGAAIVLSHINQGNIKDAESALKRYKKNFSSDKHYSTLSNTLQEKIQAREQSSKLLIKANNLINRNESLQKKRQSLNQAYSIIRQAEEIEKTNPQISSTMAALEEKYISSIKQLVSQKDNKLIEAYFSDTNQKEWESERILNLQLAYETNNKGKKKRVITGGF